MANQLGQTSSTLILKAPGGEGAENLQETLTAGNQTGGNNIVITPNDGIVFPDGTIKLISDILQDLQSVLDKGNFATVTAPGFEHFVQFREDRFLDRIDTPTQLGFTNRSQIQSLGGTFSIFTQALPFGNWNAKIQGSTSGNNPSMFISTSNSNTNANYTVECLQDKVQIESRDGLGQLGQYDFFFDRFVGDKVYPILQSEQFIQASHIQEYKEAFGTTFNNTVNSTWQTVVVPGAPANTTIDLLITNPGANLENGGARQVGSTLNRIGATKSDSFVLRVLTDVSSQIEIFSTDFTTIDFNLVGYF